MRSYCEVEREWPNTCGITFDQPEEAKQHLRTYFNDWAEPLKNYIRGARRIYSLPIGLEWDSKPGVTLIDDAAYLVPPAEYGVNLAMQDAMELSF